MYAHKMYTNKPQKTDPTGLVVIAGLAGLIAGLLLAPKRGDEMRAHLKTKYMEMKGKTKETADNAATKAQDAVDGAKDKLSDIRDETAPIDEREL